MTEQRRGAPARVTGELLADGVGFPPQAAHRAGAPRRPTRLLQTAIDELIAEDGLSPGDRLHSETELAVRLGVARASVREALKLLERDGLIYLQPGHGRFVSALGKLAVNTPITLFESVTEMLAERGLRLSTTVLSADRAKPTSAEAQALQLGADDDVVRLRRLRHDGRELVIYSANVFSAAIFGGDLAGIDFSGSLTELLADVGRGPVSSAAHMRATALPPEIAALPTASSQRAWLSIDELCIDANGDSVLQSLDYHRGDRFSFNVLRRHDTFNDDQQGALNA